jgi:riboflavin kinase
MNMVKAKGTVFSGENVGNRFIGIAWAKKQIKEKLGFDPYIGTLNIRFPEKEAKHLKKTLQDSKGIKITPAKGFFQASCFNILIMNKIKGAIIIPEKPGYPPNVLEIIAPTCLRKALSLTDSDEVEITIFLEADIKA